MRGQAIATSSLTRSIVIAATCALALSGFCIFADWYAVQPYGSQAVLFLSMFAALPAAVAAITAPIAGVTCVFSRRRREAFRVLVISLTVGVAVIGAMRVGRHIRIDAFAALAERSEPLVMAIKAYQAKHGRSPSTLEALVPEFLPAVPGTGMGAYPEYEYEVADGSRSLDGNPWMLRVFTPVGVPDFDEFIYYPRQNYPDYYWSGNPVERVRDWAYVHE